MDATGPGGSQGERFGWDSAGRNGLIRHAGLHPMACSVLGGAADRRKIPNGGTLPKPPGDTSGIFRMSAIRRHVPRKTPADTLPDPDASCPPAKCPGATNPSRGSRSLPPPEGNRPLSRMAAAKGREHAIRSRSASIETRDGWTSRKDAKVDPIKHNPHILTERFSPPNRERGMLISDKAAMSGSERRLVGRFFHACLGDTPQLEEQKFQPAPQTSPCS